MNNSGTKDVRIRIFLNIAFYNVNKKNRKMTFSSMQRFLDVIRFTRFLNFNSYFLRQIPEICDKNVGIILILVCSQ